MKRKTTHVLGQVTRYNDDLFNYKVSVTDNGKSVDYSWAITLWGAKWWVHRTIKRYQKKPKYKEGELVWEKRAVK